MWKIFKYSFSDLFRGRWSQLYFTFYLVISASLLYLSGDTSKVAISLMNIILILNRDLTLCIRPQPGQYSVLPHLSLPLHQPMRIGDGHRHEYTGFITGIAEHWAISGDCLSIEVMTAQDCQSKPMSEEL